MLQLLPVKDIISLQHAIISEKKTIIFFYKHDYDAMPITLAAISLIYPLEWEYAVVPLFTSQQIDTGGLTGYLTQPQASICGVMEQKLE